MTTLKEYRDEMNRIFARSIRHGFVDYWHCGRLGREIMELMNDATGELSARGEYKGCFPPENWPIVREQVFSAMENGKYYRKVAKNLRWMQQFPGGWETAAELAEEFRVQYKRRPAMVEEIAKF